jgi:hypothetical protein
LGADRSFPRLSTPAALSHTTQEGIMNKPLSVTLLLGIFVAAQLVTSAQEKKAEPKQKKETTVNKDEMVATIARYRQEGEQKLLDNKFTRRIVPLTGPKIKESIKQKWEKMDAYYEGTKLVRIQLYPHKSISGRTEEFYVMDDKLVFAFIQDTGPKREGKDAGEPGKEFYFQNDKLIKFEDRTGRHAANVDQEIKMYETRLPYELAQFVEILKQK